MMKTVINKMNLKCILSLTVLLVLLGFMMLGFSDEQKMHANNNFQVQTFQSGSGWGYEVTSAGHSLIKQPYIPAIAGKKPFKSQAEADKAGHLVLQKIKHHKTPALSVYELDSLKIQLK